MTLERYDAPETISNDSLHMIKLKFQYCEHKAEIVTGMGGNVYGADLLSSYDADSIVSMTAPVDNEINKKYCEFEPSSMPNAYIEHVFFFHETRDMFKLEIEEAAEYLIGIEIIQYESIRGEE